MLIKTKAYTIPGVGSIENETSSPSWSVALILQTTDPTWNKNFFYNFQAYVVFLTLDTLGTGSAGNLDKTTFCQSENYNNLIIVV